MKTAAVFIEDTLADAEVGVMCSFGDPYPTAQELLGRLRDDGYRVVVVSPSCATDFGVQTILSWLSRGELPYDEVWCGGQFPDVDLIVSGRSSRPDDLLDPPHLEMDQ